MEMLSTIVGAAIGFVASVGVVLVQRFIDYHGRMDIFCKVLYGDKSFSEYIRLAGNGMVKLTCPIKLDIVNTANVPRLLRNVSLELYYRGMHIASSTAIDTLVHTSSCNGEQQKQEEKLAYSFTVGARSIYHQECLYVANLPWTESSHYSFDALRLCYHNERNKRIELMMLKAEDGEELNNYQPEGWFKLERITARRRFRQRREREKRS